MLSVLSVAGHYGYVLRNSLFDAFPMMRHQGDIRNAFNQGRFVNDIARGLAAKDGRTVTTPPLSDIYRAMIFRFDDSYTRGLPDKRFDFDYVPLRLLIPTLWVRQLQSTDPTITEWRDGFEFTKFMLTVNTIMAGFTAVVVFLLIRHWVLRAGTKEGPSPVVRLLNHTRWKRADVPRGTTEPASDIRIIKAWALGAVGALLVWFEPNILLESHIWPQWDLWIVPFYLLAVFLCSTGWWYCAGLSLGVGVMMKGQLFFGLPVLLMWPLFDAKPGNAVRLLSGFGTAFLLVASPWLLQTSAGVRYVALVAGTVTALISCKLARNRVVLSAALPLVAAALITPVLFTESPDKLKPVLLAITTAFLLTATAWFATMRKMFVVTAITMCASVITAALAFGGTWSWWHIGFGYGTHHYQTLYMGPSVNNLAALLRDVYRWDLYDVVTTFPLYPWIASLPKVSNYVVDGQLVVTIKLLMSAIFVIALPLCAWGIAKHARRNDPRFLIAITAPWVIFFAVMPQMHERYLFWGAVIGVACIGASLGGFFLWLIVSLLSFGMILHCQLPEHPNHYLRYPLWLDETLQQARFILVRAHPGLGWLMLLLACVFLYLTLTSSKLRQKSSVH